MAWLAVREVKSLLVSFGLLVELLFKMKEPRHRILENQSFSQSSPLPSDQLASLPQADETWSPNGPVCSKDTSLIVFWWPLREVEVTGCPSRRFTALAHLRSRDVQSASGDFLWHSFTLICSETKCLNEVGLFQKVHRLLSRKKRSKSEQYRHPTWKCPDVSAVCGKWYCHLGITGMSSSVRTPSSATHGLFLFPFVLHQFYSNVTSACERKGKNKCHHSTCSPHTRCRGCGDRCASAEFSRRWWAGLGHVRVV